ncbi:SF3 helicase domain-containing protein [Trichonephila clavata]|uniref:SF3 helicase domain-containing protein n=1 Tax=Trichonephila clavata TaxID=2740835 RepID=A0A8X6KVJ1_TRICU|nr:SF3 helicase domain-containing protein [Trichonephila clavata]
MVKIKYISFILFLILIVTLVNLFYKPWLYDVKSKLPSRFTGSWLSSISRSTCPLYGFKCPTDEPCECSQMCSNGDFVPFQVLPKNLFNGPAFNSRNVLSSLRDWKLQSKDIVSCIFLDGVEMYFPAPNLVPGTNIGGLSP